MNVVKYFNRSGVFNQSLALYSHRINAVRETFGHSEQKD
jgi:hypothetical protein